MREEGGCRAAAAFTLLKGERETQEYLFNTSKIEA